MKLSLLPHEILFGIFLLQMWVRLVIARGLFFRDTLIYLALLVVNAGVIVWCRAQPTNTRWKSRLLFYPVAMNICWTVMSSAVPAINPGGVDGLLQQADTALIGRNLSLRMEPAVNPFVTELMSFCYFLFFPNLLAGMAYYFIGELELLKKFFVGLFSIYGLGFIGYSLFPAMGPYVAMADQFHVPLAGWIITRWNSEIVRMGTNHVDVFPSLHCAISSFILFFDRVHKPWRYRLYLIPAIGLWISTIYLRYHYLVDVLAGFVLSALCYWIAKRFAVSNSQQITAKAL